jgi:hypothetical protein
MVRTDDPQAGALFVQGRVADGGVPRLLDDVVGAGWRLVAVDPDVAATLPADALAWFTEIGGRVVTVDVSDDVDGTYRSWFAEHGVVAVLQRPDFHVFGSAAEPGGAGALVDDLQRCLAAPADRLSPRAPTSEPDGGTR